MFNVKKMVLAALFVSLGVVLPMAFHSIPNAGLIFLPMHIPVLLCGLICGLPYGPICGAMTPLLSSLMTGMPAAAMLPSMFCELAAYGMFSSILIRSTRFKSRYANVYIALIGAMLIGRVVSGILNALIFRSGNYSLQIWMGTAFITALPGVVIQILMIPAVVFALQKTRLIDPDPMPVVDSL